HGVCRRGTEAARHQPGRRRRLTFLRGAVAFGPECRGPGGGPLESFFQYSIGTLNMLTIRNLHATVAGKPILNGIDLEVAAGEVHATMGPTGSGKSTLANVLAGREGYEVTEGEVLFQGRNLLELEPEERAREGIFLAFQYPVEIPGVSNIYLL